MKTCIALLSINVILLTSFLPVRQQPRINREQAEKAYLYLNEIRLHPELFYEEFDFLKESQITHRALKWNDALAKAAEDKAYDMANLNYFDHVDKKGYGMNYYINNAGYKLLPEFLRNKSDNFFESIHGGGFDWADSSAYGKYAIKDLIIDEGVPSLGHRNHLLGIGDWDSTLVDIGIGIAFIDSGSAYQAYVSVIIAKHGW